MPGYIDQQAPDQDAERKERGAESANKTAVETDVSEGDMVPLMGKKQNKLSATYDPEPCSVVFKRRNLVVIERGETLLKRNVGHVKRFIDPAPQTPQPQKERIWPQEETPVREQVITTDPEPVTGNPSEGPVTEPVTEPSCHSLPLLGCQNRVFKSPKGNAQES